MSWRNIVLSTAGTLILLSAARAEGPKKLLLLSQGPDGHPVGTHEYAAGLGILAKSLKEVKSLEVISIKADNPWKEGPELLRRADGVVLFLSEGAKWIDSDPDRKKAFSDLASRGAGIVALHWALGTRDAGPIDNFLKLVGGCHGGPDRKYKVVETEVQAAEHPITAGIKNFKIRDEFYYQLKFTKTREGFQPILKITLDGKEETVAWAWERPDKGRSFGFSGLHFHDNWQREEYRKLITQAVLWAMKIKDKETGGQEEKDKETGGQGDKENEVAGNEEKLIGMKALEWEVTDWHNTKPVTLKSLAGKVVLVRWWTGRTCPYCKATGPALNEFHSQYKDKGPVVIGFYHHKADTPLQDGEVRQTAEKYGFQFPVAFDPDWQTLKRWWLDDEKRQWTSVTFLLDKKGVIRHIHPGGQYLKGDKPFQDMKAKIEELLKE